MAGPKDLKSRMRTQIALTREEVDAELPRIERQVVALQSQFELAVPAGFDVTQLMRDILQLIRKTPKLALCEPNSVLGAMMTCAQLGLRPGVGALGQAHVLPFWNKTLQRPDGRSGAYEAVFVMGYQGMIELANRSNRVASIAARPVFANEEFALDYGAPNPLSHRPVLDGDKGELRGFYSDVRLINGGQYVDYMSREDMEVHRDRYALAKTKDGTIIGPWRDQFVQMGRKTMVRQAFAYIPRATELSVAMAVDNSVRRDWNVVEGTTMEDAAETIEQVDPDDAGTPPEDDEGFVVDTSPGAPSEDEQREVFRQEAAGA